MAKKSRAAITARSAHETAGDAYLFWGYRSYHATMPVAAGHKRVTVILYYRDVHAKSRIVKYAKVFRHGFGGM